MRTAFMRALTGLAARDPRVTFLTGDLGFSFVEAFAARFPDQYVNIGVAEQNMAGVAAGLALAGRVVFTYSIGNFPTLRCLEQVRNDICYHRLNVKIVAVGGGYAYGALGASHHATEDLAVMRALPEMTVVAPGDPVEAELATRAIAAHVGPCYLRLAKSGEPIVHAAPPDFAIGRAITIRPGRDCTLISTGAMLPAAAAAAAELGRAHRVDARVVSMHTVAPLDAAAVRAACDTAAIVTIEEHSATGGLGSAVAEVLAGLRGHPPLHRVALPAAFAPAAGSQAYLLERAGLTTRAIVDGVAALLAPAGRGASAADPA
ncbi:MAG: transketolase [Acidobacteria bacterium]|nr:transketolase [Acidobacteriota bacterium]